MLLQGAKPVPFFLSVAVGVLLRFVVPIPDGITVQAWTLLSIFVSTITGKNPPCRVLPFGATILAQQYAFLHEKCQQAIVVDTLAAAAMKHLQWSLTSG